ncbi:MAG: Zn-dependent hydrolase [Pseudomonadota bacterium]
MKKADTKMLKSADAEFETVSRLFSEIAALSADAEGVSRPAYSTIETQTLSYLENFAAEHELSVRYDAAKCGVFSLPEDADADQFVAIGSHVDSVPSGGNFDGLAGVIAGIMCLCKARQEGKRFKRPVKVLAMRAEESAWFGPCYVSSKIMFGALTEEERLSCHNGDGRTLETHMAEIGIDIDKVRRQEPLADPASFLEYIELHIEQGPLLVEKKLPTAIVSGIRGNLRHKKIRCIGQPGHSGAVPRAYRRDPVLATCDLLHRLDESWLTVLQKGGDLVLTSGIVATDPEKHSLSRIPDQVDFSFDIRSQSAETLMHMRSLLHDEMKIIERERKVRFELDQELSTSPAICDQEVVDGLLAAMERSGFEPFLMASGGGHDAAVFSNAQVPTAMVFVRNRNGSHNPGEAMEVGDLLAGTSIIYNYLMGSNV